MGFIKPSAWGQKVDEWAIREQIPGSVMTDAVWEEWGRLGSEKAGCHLWSPHHLSRGSVLSMSPGSSPPLQPLGSDLQAVQPPMGLRPSLLAELAGGASSLGPSWSDSVSESD